MTIAEPGYSATLTAISSGVFTIVEETSNTIFLGETICATDLQLSSDAVIDVANATPVPAPPALVLGMTGLALLFASRRQSGHCQCHSPVSWFEGKPLPGNAWHQTLTVSLLSSITALLS